VYAFMRHADDLSDEPGLDPGERRTRLSEWLARLGRVRSGEATDDPVLMALADAQYRYAIPPAWLEMLVEGTAMDVEDTAPSAGSAGSREENSQAGAGRLEPGEGSGIEEENGSHSLKQYDSFEQLYNYCYHVASVVGLICIRIFGYRDPAAEPLAERCGIAFQLTNIIRDVKEDAALGRVYLPREDMDRFQLSADELLHPDSGSLRERFRPLLAFEAERAREFYQSGEQLLDYIDEDSRPALWVLVTIYRNLLNKIIARNYDVFGEKVRLSCWEKTSVLARGVWQRLT